MQLTIENIKPYLLFECISGSRAYGLETATSDTDIKGVFYLPKEVYYGLGYTPQINNETNDIVYYELGRFVELLCASNPNILELLNAPDQTVLYRHPLMDMLKPQWFLSKTCIKTFAHYAQGQIKKAQGLNKKIVNPVDKKLKTILDFCYILDGVQSTPLKKWLHQKSWKQNHIGLAQIPHAHDLYALYYDEYANYQGIIKSEDSRQVLLSSISKDAPRQAYLSFNQDGYSSYRKKYHEYWQWVKNRNEARYQQNIEHQRSYDSKNMMHTFRLLYMALDIARYGEIRVWRENRNELLDIKQGHHSYEQLVQRSEHLLHEIEAAFNDSLLSPEVNQKAALETLITMRDVLYTNRPDPASTSTHE